jgi:glycosyltransferase involved in cell wall biosynthesis
VKILRIIASGDLAGGGPIEGVRRVGKALALLGHQQQIVTLDPIDAPFLAESDTIALGRPSYGVDRGMRARWAPSAPGWLRANLPNYDIAIVSGLWNHATLAARRALIGGPIPYVVFTHGMLDPWFRRTYPIKTAAKQLSWLLSEGPLLKNAAAVLFTSEEERRLARGAFWPYHVNERVVAYGTADVCGDSSAQVEAFHASVPDLGKRRFLLFLSRVHEKKGCDLLVRAFADIAANDPTLDLVIAGPDETGLRAPLAARAMELGVGERIHWPGMLQGNAKWGAFQACEAFVLPSHQENFGIVVAEAMACGRPVLITNKVNIWREVETDGAGLIADDTVAGVGELLVRFQALSSLERATMGERARTCFLRRFHIDEAARDLVRVLETALVEPLNLSSTTPRNI